MLETQRETVPHDDGGEKDTALAFLDFVRSCAFKKIDGLDEEQLRRRLVVSETTLLGLIRHMTDGERYWFSYVVGGDERWADVEFPMAVEEGRSAEDVIAEYRAAVAESRAVLASREFDDRTVVPVHDQTKTVRWVVAHMTGETARHVGHADILRELLDGTTGR